MNEQPGQFGDRVGVPKLPSSSPFPWEYGANPAAELGDEAVALVVRVARLLQMADATIDTDLVLGHDPETNDQVLKLFVTRTSLKFRQAEELLDATVASALEALNYPDVPFVAAMR